MTVYWKEIKETVRSDWEDVSPRLKRILLALLIGCAQMFLFAGAVGNELDSWTLRQWFSLRGEREISQDVTLVRIDSATYANLRVPRGGMISRQLLATAIDRIHAAGARLVVVDLFFLAEGDDRAADRELARALRDAPTVIGHSVSRVVDSDPSGERTIRIEQRPPLALFRQSANLVLPMQVPLGQTALVERIALPTEFVAAMEVNVPLLKAVRQFDASGLEEPGQFDYINYYGEPASLTSVSFHKLLNPATMPSDEYFRDRIVLIGVATHAAPGVSGEDSFQTPVSGRPMYGVEIHATIAANLLDGSWIHRHDPRWEVSVLSLLTFTGTLWLLSLTLRKAAMVVAAAAGIWAALSFACFVHYLTFVPGVTLFGVVFPIFVATWAFIAKRGTLDWKYLIAKRGRGRPA